MDCTDGSSIEQMAEEVHKCVRERGLSLLINNAGFYDTTPFSKLTADVMTKSFLVNAASALLVTKALLPLLQTSAKVNEAKPLGWTRAAIVNITSGYGEISGESPAPYAYGTSKAALNFITNNLNKEYKDQGIIAAAIDPGWVRTDMGGKMAPTTTAKSVKGMLAVIEKLDGNHDGYYHHTGKCSPW
jgi:NAD(P)-dependent dehydrogenase (short-subunit alcohol dehydrogenase family)